MTTSVHNEPTFHNEPTPQDEPTLTLAERIRAAKVPLTISWRETAMPLIFMFSLSLVGLQVLPAIVITLIVLFNRLVKDRYDFLIMLGVMCSSGYTFLANDVVHFQVGDLALALSLPALFMVRKNKLVKRVSFVVLFYFIFMLFMAFLSSERLWVQLMMIRYYVAFIFYFFVLWVFANRDFDIRYFFKRVLVFTLIISAFYAIDSVILSGWFFIPNDNGAWFRSSITKIAAYPFSFIIPRKWPGAYSIIIVAAFAIARHYKLNWWQWALLLTGLGITRTMTFIVPFFLTIVIFQGTFKKFFVYFVFASFFLALAYIVDYRTGSNLRIASTIRQFVELASAQDEEDVAEFGTSRMAQVIPKYEMLVNNNAVITGLGFIHPEYTTDPRYQIHNELYSDISKSDESVANLTEVSQFNVIIHTGVIGLIVQTVFFLTLYRVLRRRGRNADFYLSTLLMATIMGFGGMADLNHPRGLIWVGMALGAVLLTSRPRAMAAEAETPAVEASGPAPR